jgi:hypothetical protein
MELAKYLENKWFLYFLDHLELVNQQLLLQ